MNELMSDGLLAIVAGSDTTSHVMINAFYFLMKHSEMQERLQREIDDVFPPGSSPFDPVKQANMPYLNAVL